MQLFNRSTPRITLALVVALVVGCSLCVVHAGSVLAQEHGGVASGEQTVEGQLEEHLDEGHLEGRGEHGGESGGLFSGNIGNAIWTLVIFAVLLWVLGKYAWGPILDGLQQRESFIRESLEEAKDERDQAEHLLKQYESKLAAARGEVDEILDEARRDADALRQREEQAAREEAEKMIQRARREIDIATETAVKELYANASKLSVEVAGKILQRELSPADHARLIDEAVDAFEDQAEAS